MSFLMRLFLALHRSIYRATSGRLMGEMGNMRVLLLTTRGRRSGRQRTIPLTYLERDGRIVLVASAGGSDRHPAWLLNLQADPSAEVQIGRATQTMKAEVASPETRARLWPQIISDFPNYGAYQEKTEREIPLVLLHNTGAS